MSLSDLKSAVDRLPSDELAELSAYIQRQEDVAWDDQIDADFAPGGRLSAVLDEVRSDTRGRWGGDLAEMAADPDIQREMGAIESEFAVSENDGLNAI